MPISFRFEKSVIDMYHIINFEADAVSERKKLENQCKTLNINWCFYVEL